MNFGSPLLLLTLLAIPVLIALALLASRRYISPGAGQDPIPVVTPRT